MKNIRFLYIIAVTIVLGLISCEDDYDPEVTKAAEFAGEWFYQVQTEAGDVYMDYDYHSSTLLTYNSAANLPNEVWFDDQGVFLYFKSKFKLTGTAANFESSDLAINEYEFEMPEEAPTSAGETVEVESVDYGVVRVTDGKILEGAATVWQDKEKAQTDSIYFKTEFYTATFNFISVESNGGFAWELADPPFIIDETTQEIYVVSGHRKTGWEVYIE